MPSIDPPSVYTFATATSPYGRDYLNLNLKMVRGDDFSYNIQVLNNGSAQSLTSSTLRMTAKWLPTDVDASAVFSINSPSSGITITSAAGGLATVTVANTLTNVSAIPFHPVNLYYDTRVTGNSVSGTPGTINTIMYGQLTIVPDITRTAP